MRYVKPEYISVFKDCIAQTSEQSGYTLPEEVEAYVAILLGSFVEKPNFLPNSTFAESYLRLAHRDSLPAKELADVCLFVVGVFPAYGIGKDYYANIGKSSYDLASKQLNYNLFTQLCQQFDIVTEIIQLSTIPPKHNIRIG